MHARPDSLRANRADRMQLYNTELRGIFAIVCVSRRRACSELPHADRTTGTASTRPTARRSKYHKPVYAFFIQLAHYSSRLCITRRE